MLASAAEFALINNKEEKTFKRLFLAVKHARYSPNGKISFFARKYMCLHSNYFFSLHFFSFRLLYAAMAE